MGSSSYSLQMASPPLPRSLPQCKQPLLFLHTTSGLSLQKALLPAISSGTVSPT